MNTRSFIKSLLVAAVAPTVLAPVLKDRFRWKVNPEYENAWYEIHHYYPREFCGKWVFKYQGSNGLWMSNRDGKVAPCFAPDKYVEAPYSEWVMPSTDEQIKMIFHKREPC